MFRIPSVLLYKDHVPTATFCEPVVLLLKESRPILVLELTDPAPNPIVKVLIIASPPDTCSFELGAVVPIPTFPFKTVLVMLSLPKTALFDPNPVAL